MEQGHCPGNGRHYLCGNLQARGNCKAYAYSYAYSYSDSQHHAEYGAEHYTQHRTEFRAQHSAKRRTQQDPCTGREPHTCSYSACDSEYPGSSYACSGRHYSSGDNSNAQFGDSVSDTDG